VIEAADLERETTANTSAPSGEIDSVDSDADKALDDNEIVAEAAHRPFDETSSERESPVAGGENRTQVLPTHQQVAGEALSVEAGQDVMGADVGETYSHFSEEGASVTAPVSAKGSTAAGPAGSQGLFSSSLNDPTVTSSQAPPPAGGPIQIGANIVSQPSADANAASLSPVPGTVRSDTTPPAAQIPPPDPSQLRDEANLGRVIRGLGNAIHQRGGSLTLRLDPPELGAVRIELNVRDGLVQARFVTQQESVRNLLMDQMGHLRQALDRQGLTIERIEVQAMPHAHDGRLNMRDPDDGRGANQQSTRQHGRGHSRDKDRQTSGQFESAFLESTKG
jgi:flagellar hook-length control protein FliK